MIDAERAVIGCMLLKPELADKAIGTLNAAMFESELHGKCFQVIKKLRQAGQAHDWVAVDSKLPGNRDELVLCAETVPSVSGIDSYCNAVLDAWRSRKLITGLSSLISDGLSADDMTIELRKLVEQQEYIMNHQLQTTAKSFSDAQIEWLQWLRKPDDSFKTEWSGFDRLSCGLQRNGVVGISARPGGGKTALALQIACAVSKEHKVLYQSMEMPKEQIMSRIYARSALIDSSKFATKTLSDDEYKAIAEISSILRDRFRLVIDDSAVSSVASIEQNIQRIQPELVVVDHLTLIKPESKKQKRNDEIAELTRDLKQLAMKHHICIIALVQAKREADGKKIGLGDMFGSSTIEQDVDMLIGINREPDGGEVEQVKVSIIKNRHGGCGDINMVWEKKYHRFSEVVDME